MNWEPFLVAALSALVSLATAIVFKWWESRKVEWLITGTAHNGYDHGRKTGTYVAELEVHNVGDGDAYNVQLVRCNGGKYKSFKTFEAGRLAAGDSFRVTFDTKPEAFDTAWFEIIFQPSPVHRRKPRTSRRYLVGALVGDVQDSPPNGTSRQEQQARGKRIYE